MTEEIELTRFAMTFGQSEGVEPLPTQMKLREISPALSSRLWMVIHASLEKATKYSTMGGPPWLDEKWSSIIFDWHTLVEHKYADELSKSVKDSIARVKALVTSANYVDVFNFVEFLAKHRSAPYQICEKIDWALRSSHAAYRLIDRVIVPITSQADAQAVIRAFVDLGAEPYRGARSHLREAGKLLTQGDYASSIRNSVHAVESVARTLAPGTNTLNPALAILEKKHGLHGALKSGFGSLYGFSSDEDGIRHALIDDANAKVDEVDALYMFGACAAFVSYLIGRSRET